MAGSPAEEKKSGRFNNLAAGLNEGVYDIIGAPVDGMAWLYNAAAAQARAISGAPVRNVEKPNGGSAWIGSAVNRATDAVANPLGYDGVNDPANVEPRGPLERTLRVAGQGAGSALAPEAIVGALGRAGMLTPGAMQMFAPIFGDGTSVANTARNVGIGAAGGVGADQAASATEDATRPYLGDTGARLAGSVAGVAGGLAGGIGGDLAISGAGAAARGAGRAGEAAVDGFAPTQASQERVAGRMLRDAASDPDAIAAMDTNTFDILPGSAPTTFQATGDMGLGGLERAVATRNPEAFNQRRADQNAARLDALDALAPDGAPDALPRSLRGDAAAADAVTAQDIDAATARAAQDVRGLGGDLPPETSGAVIRQRVLDADSVAREQERGLWQAVDPDGTLTIPTGETIGTARQIVEEMPGLAQPMGGTEAAIFGAVRALDGQPLPFRELHALRSRVSEAMRDELKTNGRTTTYGRLTRLRGAIERDLEGSVLNSAENGATPASGVSLEDTLGSPAPAAAADDGWPGPAPESFRATGREAVPSQPDAVMQEAADIATGRRAPYRVPSFMRWIAARGGVRPDANVEAILNAADRQHGGIISLAGRSADEWGEAIAEHAGMRQRPDQNQVLDWISEAANGRDPDWWRALHANPEREDAARIARDIQRIASEEGIQLRTRRAALDLIKQEAGLYGGGRAAEPAPSPSPMPIRPATFDDAAQERLRAATEATKARARTFVPLKDITRTRGTANDFATPDAVVPQRVFVPGAKGQATVKAYLDAVGDEGRAPLHDFAVASLRRVAEKPDGTLDPSKVSAWRAKHRDALRALPETDKALASAADASAAVDELAATRRQAMEMRQDGIVGRMMGLEDPQDVTRAVGSIFGKQDAVAQMKRLAEATAGNEDARAGLRRAIADHINQRFISNTEAATSGNGTVKSDSFQTFIRKNERALSTVFNGEEVANLKRIAADLQRANRSIAAVRIPGQSNTAQDLAALAKGERSTLDIVLSAVGGTWAGGPLAGIAAAMGAKAINAARRAGMQKVDDLVRDALLDPALAKALMQKTASGRGTQTLTRRLLHNALKGWGDGPFDDGPGGGAPSGGTNGGGNGAGRVRSPLEVFNPARRGDQLPRGSGADLPAGTSGAAALREHEPAVADMAPSGLRSRVSGDAGARVERRALSAQETILSGTGKPMPDRWAANNRLRALKLDPKDFELRPVDGGFVAARNTDIADAGDLASPAPGPGKMAEEAKPSSAHSIRDDMRARLADAGVPEKELDANAAVMEAYYKTRAKRLGVDAETLYREQAPDIRSGQAPETLGPDEMGQLAGINAKTADKEALSLAASMEKKGINKDEIWRVTGWGRGKDGKWRFEIPDYKGYFSENIREILNKGQKARLSDVYHSPDVYAAYPELADMKVGTVLARDRRSIIGYYDHDSKTIRLRHDGEELRSTLLHEMQHAIQKIEGHGYGSDASYISKRFWLPSEHSSKLYNNLSGEVESRATQRRRDFDEDLSRHIPPWNSEDVPREKQWVMTPEGSVEVPPPKEDRLGMKAKWFTGGQGAVQEQMASAHRVDADTTTRTGARTVHVGHPYNQRMGRRRIEAELKDSEDALQRMHRAIAGGDGALGDMADSTQREINVLKDALHRMDSPPEDRTPVPGGGQFTPSKVIPAGDGLVVRVATDARHGALDGEKTFRIHKVPEGVSDGASSKAIGPSLGDVTVTRHPDGRWEVAYVHVRPTARRQGAAKALYAAVEKELGIDMHPSGILLPDGYAMWNKRAPDLVKWHRKYGDAWLSPKHMLREIKDTQRKLAQSGVADTEHMVLETHAKRLQELVDNLPAEAKSKEAPDRMFQGDDAAYRGAAILGDGRAVIELFKARDASTFMHEAGHVFLRDMVADAAKAPAIKADLDEVLKWFGTEDASKITREHHEQFARGFEQYLRDGKAPSVGLKRAFEQFKDWLTGIYRSLTELGQPIPDTIKGVYDRMLSAEKPHGAPETILSGTGKPMPSKGAALHRLQVLNLDAKNYDLKPVDGGFVAERKSFAQSQDRPSTPFQLHGYKPSDLVPSSTGSNDYGEIPVDVGKAIGREPAPIKLPAGNADYGLHHINAKGAEITKEGFVDGRAFVESVARDYDHIYPASGRRLMLVKRSIVPTHSLVVELNPTPDGHAYTVVTGGMRRDTFFKEKKPLWGRAPTNQPPE